MTHGERKTTRSTEEGRVSVNGQGQGQPDSDR